MQEKIDVLGMSFDNRTKNEVIHTLKRNITDHKTTFIVTANPEIVMYAHKDPQYKEVVQSADITVADGIGVIIGSKMLKNPLPERIPGIELMLSLLDIANEEKLKVFFLGAKEDVLHKMLENIKHTYPNLVIAGSHHGYFKDEDDRILESVKQADAELVFVALGYPRQEKWIKDHLCSFNKGIFMGVGGSFDVLAGKVQRAPVIWQKLNLEWFYRLLKQPSRWRRMFVLPLFLVEVWKQR